MISVKFAVSVKISGAGFAKVRPWVKKVYIFSHKIMVLLVTLAKVFFCKFSPL
jgi:hypothetical protein